jgi:uncharacterized membrane protein YdjX (TVP38/TMEM64 family)
MASLNSDSDGAREVDATDKGFDVMAVARRNWDATRHFAAAFKVPKMEDDDLEEAVALNAALKAAEADPKSADVSHLADLTGAYYGASFNRIFDSPAVKDALPTLFTAANGALVLLVLRVLLPRLLAIETMGDLSDFAPELGLPSREDLLGYVELANDMSFATKVVLFLIVITLEKVLLVGDFVPVGVVLPAISPILFGGVLEGTVISAACAALGSTVNFLLAKLFLKEKALQLEVFGQPPVGESAWFTALGRNIEKDGFKAALFLRLAPVLPIPIDAHWYVCGLTPLKTWEFTSAYFVGALKATFLDAFLGSMLCSAAIGSDEIAEGSRAIIVVETVAIVAVSVLVSQFATQVFAEMMTEEGFDAIPGAAVSNHVDDAYSHETTRERRELDGDASDTRRQVQQQERRM